MRILVVRDGHVTEDVSQGRAVLTSEIGHPSKIVMIIRGDSAEISRFADKADGRAAPFAFREVVWVKDIRIFSEGQEAGLFENEPQWCAVVLNLEDEPVVWLTADASTFDVDMSFLDAQASGGV